MSPTPPTSLKDRLRLMVPFGLARTKPRHFRDMLRVAWENKDNLRYAWDVLSKGVCDGCALGVAGFHDWTIDGVHLCMTRLKLLETNTVGAFDPAVLADVARLHDKSGAELRALGRLGHPMRRRRGEPGFHRISWGEALDAVASGIRVAGGDRTAIYV